MWARLSCHEVLIVVGKAEDEDELDAGLVDGKALLDFLLRPRLGLKLMTERRELRDWLNRWK